MAIGSLWETLKDAITAYSGLSPAAFFTVLAVAAAFYYVFFQIFGNTAPPPSNTRHFVEPPPPPVQLGEITTQDLSQYNGSDPKKPLLMAIKGKIYDVSQSRMFYGPGGPYELFAGKDASRALAKMSFEEADLTGDISGLGPFELEALQDWEYKFMGKYVEVGTIKDPESTRNTSSDDVTEPTIADSADMSTKKPVEEEAGSLANDSDDKLTHKENDSDEKHAQEENGSIEKLVETGHAKEEGEKGHAKEEGDTGHAKEEGEKGHAKEEAESGKN